MNTGIKEGAVPTLDTFHVNRKFTHLESSLSCYVSTDKHENFSCIALQFDSGIS